MQLMLTHAPNLVTGVLGRKQAIYCHTVTEFIGFIVIENYPPEPCGPLYQNLVEPKRKAGAWLDSPLEGEIGGLQCLSCSEFQKKTEITSARLAVFLWDLVSLRVAKVILPLRLQLCRNTGPGMVHFDTIAESCSFNLYRILDLWAHSDSSSQGRI